MSKVLNRFNTLLDTSGVTVTKRTDIADGCPIPTFKPSSIRGRHVRNSSGGAGKVSPRL